MANLQVKDIDDKLYMSLRALAHQEKRSISQEVVLILQKYLSLPGKIRVSPTEKFLELAGSWDDERSASEISEDIRRQRRSGTRFGDSDELFD